jgi:hypothetical protein
VYYPPPQKTTSVVLVVVVVVIVVVLATVVLAAVLYVMMAGLITDGTNQRPVVTLGAPNVSGAEVTFAVARASRSVSSGLYSVNLFVNTTVGTPQPLGSSFTIDVGPDTFTGSFFDLNGDGLLNAGDRFRVSAAGGWRPGTTYQFELLWSDLSPIGFLSWTT